MNGWVSVEKGAKVDQQKKKRRKLSKSIEKSAKEKNNNE
jgi:hypothetical protein